MRKFFSSRNLMSWIWPGIMIFATDFFAQSEDIKFEHISLEHGLSQATVFCTLQDSKGFMWFGTQDGLNKYG